MEKDEFNPDKLNTEFIELYNKLENLMGIKTKSGEEEKFITKLDKLCENEGKYRSHKEDLKIVNKLRTLITHNLYYIKVACPTPWTIEKLKIIINMIENHPTVNNIGTVRNNIFFGHTSDRIKYIIDKMNSEDFSYTPILDDNSKFIGVLSEHIITKWLGDIIQNEDNAINFADKIDSAKIEVIRSYIVENTLDWKFLPRNTDIDRLIDLFSVSKQNVNTNIIFITENGIVSEEILRLITVWDVVAAMKKSDTFNE